MILPKGRTCATEQEDVLSSHAIGLFLTIANIDLHVFFIRA
jgi:hypothetical protein